ncbi:MAG: MATE family efflux transporter [Clostridia bacterium]|nr:MATE family efflux transporter [Clostridia bacterium]
MTKAKYSLTEGPIWKAMLFFAMPVFLSNLLQQLYNTFDAWCVGNYINDNALAAVSSSGSLIFLLVGFFNGLAMGAGVVIARYYGAKEYDRMSRSIHTSVAFGLICGIALSIAGVILTPFILKLMGTPTEVLPQSVEYFRYYFMGAVFTVMYNIFVGILHSVGDSKHPLFYLIISTAVNIVLDILFVAVMGLGVGWAAIATTISQGISALLCFIHLLRVKSPYRISIPFIKIDFKSLCEMLRYGLPSGIQNSVISVANVFVQANINSFGKAAMAGCGSYSKLEGFAFLPVICFSQSLSTFVGQNLGAGNHNRAKRGTAFGIICGCVMAELIGIVSYIFAPRLIGFFTDSAESIALGSQHMRTICLFYCLLAFSHCAAGVLRGAGKAMVPMITMLTIWCVIRVSYITAAVRIVNELTTVSTAYPLTWTLSGIVFIIYLTKADWIHNFDKTKEKQL